jgi:alpha-L-fucosidase
MGSFGDYETPEQGVPIVAPTGIWEFCVTMNDSWGYQVQDHNHKSERQLIRLLAETIGMGGNMLLGIGPHADGTLQPEQVRRLKEIGQWVSRHKPAIFGTEAGLPCGHHYGPTMLSRDGRSLYLVLLDPPQDQIALKGMLSEVKEVRSMATGQSLEFKNVGGAPWNNVPGTLWIDVPINACDPLATIIEVICEEPIQVYRGSGHAIQSN